MPSWQSYLLDPCIRFTVKRSLKRIKTPEAARGAFEHLAPRLPKGTQKRRGKLGGVPGEWVSAGGVPAGTMLYLHGGGYFSCSPITHRSITGGFAKSGLAVFAADYRLAPEHPFPAALDDAVAVYTALLRDGVPAERLVLAGDSAGGGLVLATLLAAKAASLPMPAAAILFSPWTDLAATGDSLVSNQLRDPMLHGDRIAEAASLYIAGADPTNPLISPLYGDLSGLPPLCIQVSDSEVLRDDSLRLEARLLAAGVTVELKIWQSLPHVWQLFQGFLPEARDALAQASAFARRNLRG